MSREELMDAWDYWLRPLLVGVVFLSLMQWLFY